MTTNISTPAAADTVLFIHGLWMTPRSWENWAARYESRGYKVLAPSWPGMEAEVEELNRDSSPIAHLDVTHITDHYDKIIRALDKPPIIMGHSLGGTVMQLLLDRGLGAAAVGVAAGTVKGVPDLPLSTIWATLPVLGNPFNPGKATPLSAEQFHYAFANTLSKEESDKIYERYHVPCANRVLFEAAFASFHNDAPTAVDFDRAGRAPLLFIAFEHDHIIPPDVSRHNAEKYGESKAVTEFHEFLGRPHFPGAPGWEDVADYALAWATKMQKVS
ncbi:MAG: alpha/beta hydrolase [Fibrella sp.]|nr:alpha/beta hydrolase [Armatimonadota bacterium]